ncbi:GNAT family N-acetyltransferase [Pyxidicoccus fallax]|uniref:GNAT family N-acetyltransferase n=1 Tax=Pyxidicoccus fallax TaxID=394095 RepID=A0A848LUV6_9BACT|nr:GNAT family N-acetyltransferase [Pyxidicoccus fallax]NMO21775.1 GNAT family N-acetyltransferase [Pyxidicoccus fallax]NPC83210.1 GNAT family N-acetyltransferase [Pyxidicoccus fallax]
MSPLFQAADLTAEHVPDADVELFQPLLEHCEDFFLRCYGRPANPDEAKVMLTERPPTAGGGHLTALRDSGGKWVGILESVFDFPAPAEWYLGLMLLAPEVRGHGRGEAVIRAYEAWLRGQGARLLRLGVAEPNPDALRFWTRMGFREELWVGPIKQGVLEYRVLRMSKALV